MLPSSLRALQLSLAGCLLAGVAASTSLPRAEAQAESQANGPSTRSATSSLRTPSSTSAR